jgi:tRNA (cmo5U34)-methyltransferase
MQDQVMPKDKWSFDGEVTAVFDDMLSRSIPQYELMRKACFDLACQYIQPRTDVVDLGCSRGEAMALLVDRFGAHNRFVGIEVSAPMLEAARARFKGLIDCGVVDIRKMDLRTGYPPVKASLTLAILTIQFTPIEYRQRILRDVFKSTLSGGALIMVEKVLGNCSEIDEAMITNYYALKVEHGYSQDQIQRKRLSLEGVLVPVTAHWNEELLRTAGFTQVDCFWRSPRDGPRVQGGPAPDTSRGNPSAVRRC